MEEEEEKEGVLEVGELSPRGKDKGQYESQCTRDISCIEIIDNSNAKDLGWSERE
jgi:hypothetical protein